MYVTISSNGTLIKEKVKEVQRADKIKFSLDGPERMNDLIRGAGVHRKVLEAIEICKNKGIEVDLNTVISKYTKFSSILYLFDIARKYNVGIYFQPVDQDYSGNSSKDITSCLPDEKYFKKIITFLIEEKLKGNTFINNSISGLKYIYNWPYGKKIKCLASRIFCSISPEGKIFICDNFPHYQQYLVPVKGSFKKSFYNLSLPHDCNQCWNASMLELNLMSRMRPQFFFDIWKRLKK
jgi:MoaA/NifB/PqqE/SkfB family radical SAM enzyme